MEEDQTVPEHVYNSVTYVDKRGGNILKRYEFYCTEDTEHNMHKRVIVPFYWKGELIGSSARTFEDGIKPKYYSDYEPNFVFNMDHQAPEKKFVIVTEGPFDAMAIDGVAVLSNECSEVQADIIDSLGREVIVVPDFDLKTVKGRETWAGYRLVEQAMDYGWSVSFPIWRDEAGVKDVSEAVKRYGKLFTLKTILQGKQSTKLKIELMSKKIHS
jgi:DNA primase